MPSALITGITGQDGGYLAEQLVNRGTAVHGIVRPGEAPPQHLGGLSEYVVLHECDFRDEARLAEVVTTADADWVFNLAGLSSVAQSWAEPALTAEINGLLVARLLELVQRRQHVSGRQVRFVQASSAEIFAGALTAPQNESTPLSPRSPYGASKAFAHHLVQVLRTQGLHASNAILYNHESPRRPAGFVTRKITTTVAAIARGEASELVLGNLDARRDWGWAPDYVDAMVRMAEHDEADDYVVATGQCHTVADFVRVAFAAAGIDNWERWVRIDPAFLRPVDAVELVGDATHAREVLGWRPTVGLEELVRHMLAADAEAPILDT